MLFQMCYGPEIKSIFNVIQRNPECSVNELRELFQYREEGDIKSLILGVIKFLEELDIIVVKNRRITTKTTHWDVIDILSRIHNVANTDDDEESMNFVFSKLYFELFVKTNRMFIKDMHYVANTSFTKTTISEEKINSWKRIMEYFGLGYRAYSGFYALPHIDLIKNVIDSNGKWEGPLQTLISEKFNPIIPCVYKGNAFNGILFSLEYLNQQQYVSLTRKQDLPFSSYGQQNQWNWVRVGGNL